MRKKSLPESKNGTMKVLKKFLENGTMKVLKKFLR